MRQFAGIAALAVTMTIAGAYWLSGRMAAPEPVAADRGAVGEDRNVTDTAVTERQPAEAQGDFDFYVLALSWSPTFCDSEAAGRNREQCGEDKDFGWVVHGLWPQNESGWPENCPTSEGDRVPQRIGRSVIDIMPSIGLIGHQWRKHGSCSGLAMSDYFSLVRQAYDTIRIPDELSDGDSQSRTSPQAVEAAFIRSNPGLPRSAVAVTCDRERIDEVRICLDRSLGFRACPEVDSRSCRRSEILIPPTR